MKKLKYISKRDVGQTALPPSCYRYRWSSSCCHAVPNLRCITTTFGCFYVASAGCCCLATVVDIHSCSVPLSMQSLALICAQNAIFLLLLSWFWNAWSVCAWIVFSLLFLKLRNSVGLIWSLVVHKIYIFFYTMTLLWFWSLVWGWHDLLLEHMHDGRMRVPIQPFINSCFWCL